jgi:hypothetical protein
MNIVVLLNLAFLLTGSAFLAAGAAMVRSRRNWRLSLVMLHSAGRRQGYGFQTDANRKVEQGRTIPMGIMLIGMGLMLTLYGVGLIYIY